MLLEKLLAAEQLLPEGSSVALLIKDDSGQTLLASNSERLLAPASTLKLWTAVAAYLQLGEDFYFTTELRSAANGDAALVFSGGPLFRREQLRQLLLQAKKQGLVHISGDLLLDGSIFDGYWWGPAQSWDDQSICFAAPASAVSVNHNCVYGNLDRNTDSAIAEAYIPGYEPLSLTTDVEIVSARQKQASLCELRIFHQPDNQYSMEGCVVRNEQRLPLAIAVKDPVAYATAIIREEARALGIRIDGNIRPGTVKGGTDLLVSYHSAPLGEYLKVLLKKSDNLVADVLLKTIGSSYFQQPGNYHNSAAAVREILARDAGLDLLNSRISDGSGLSSYNLVSASLMGRLLDFIAGMESSVVRKALPVSGVDGSLLYMRGIINPPLKGRITAKSGYVFSVHNLVGFIQTARDERLQFVLMLSGVSMPENILHSQKKLASRGPVADYYEAFFTALYQL